MNINTIHHNIMNRIRERSFKNQITLKNKTFKLLKQYMGNTFNKIKRSQIQNTSWFNEKSRNNFLQDMNHFLNNSINILEKGELSPISPGYSPKNYKNILKERKSNKRIREMLDNREKKDLFFQGMKTINVANNNYVFPNNFRRNRRSSEIDLSSISGKNNFLSLNYEPKLNFKKKKLQNKSLSLNKNLNDVKFSIDKMEQYSNTTKNSKNKSGFFKQSQSINSNTKIMVKFKDVQETQSLSNNIKDNTLDYSSYEISSEMTKEEEENIMTLKDIYSEGESLMRNKIKSTVQKEKILNLFKIQTKMIEIFGKKIDGELKDEIKKISDLNNILYNKVFKYFSNNFQNEDENKTINQKELIKENPISFTIKSSYSNLNNLTKGKIIINNNYKIDIKNLVQNYMKEKNNNSMKSLDYFVKDYYNNKNNSEKKEYYISPNESPKKRKKVKFNVNNSSKNVRDHQEKTTTQILSSQIKKTITNKIESYKNFKNFDFDDNISQIKIKNVKTKNNSNSFNKFNTGDNSLENIKTNSGNVFTKIINSIYSKIKVK